MEQGLRKEELDRKRIQTARFSVGSAVVLAVTKLFVGIASGSLGVLSSAFDNLADILMSGVNYLSIKKSMEPADFSHPYGHGKAETLGTGFMSIIVALTGAWIVREGIHRLRAGIIPSSVDTGLVVMALSVAASWYIAGRIWKAGEETGSNALKADSLHYRTDVYSSGGILVSLLVYRVTGWKWLDPGVAMVVGCYIVFAAVPIFREALGDLMDRSLPPETVEKIRRIIDIWSECRGPFLFGGFTAADAMYAPVVLRFLSTTLVQLANNHVRRGARRGARAAADCEKIAAHFAASAGGNASSMKRPVIGPT